MFLNKKIYQLYCNQITKLKIDEKVNNQELKKH